MKNIVFVLFLAIVFFQFTACNNSSNRDIETIKSLEKEVFAMKVIEKDKGMQLVDAYVDFAKDHPKDSLSSKFLFKAGDVAMNLKMSDQAILYFNHLLALFPEAEKAPESIFLIGFIYENQLGDLKKAEEQYHRFLNTYPMHALADDAQAALKYLGKSPEELVKMFQEQNKQ